MAVFVQNLVSALASVAAAGSFVHNDGFATVANTGPGVYLLTMNSPVDVDQIDILCSARGGYACGGRYVNPSQIEIRTADSTGPVNAPFDVFVTRSPLASDVIPLPDPVANWTAGGGVSSFTPNVYMVTPTLPTPPGMFATIGAAIAQAQLDGFGGITEYPRALVVVFPGTYPERVDLVPGIDVTAWIQVRGFQTRIAPPPGPGTGVLRFIPPPGGAPQTTHVTWRGIDVFGSDPLEPMFSFEGADPGKIYMSQCSLEGAGSQSIRCFNSSAPVPGTGRSELRLEKVTMRNSAGTCFQLTGTFADCELTDCFMRRDDSIDFDAIDILGNVAPGPNLRLNRCEIDGVTSNTDGVLASGLSQHRTAAVPVVVAGNPAPGIPNTTLLTCLLLSGAAGQPLVAGAGTFLNANCGVAPTGAPTGPFDLALNGGAGPSDSLPVSFTSSAFGGLFLPPLPQDFTSALLRAFAAIVAGAPPGLIP